MALVRRRLFPVSDPLKIMETLVAYRPICLDIPDIPRAMNIIFRLSGLSSGLLFIPCLWSFAICEDFTCGGGWWRALGSPCGQFPRAGFGLSEPMARGQSFICYLKLNLYAFSLRRIIRHHQHLKLPEGLSSPQVTPFHHQAAS